MRTISNHISFDKSAFELLFREHFVSLCGFARGYVHDEDAAKEIVQDVLINVWEKRDTLAPDKPIKAYLFSSVRNRCLNYIRDHKKFKSYFLDVELEESSPVMDPDHLVGEEINAQIEQALSKLPEKCREVFELSRFSEMKYKDIADQLNISVKTVEVHVSKALKILREELKDLLGLLLWLIIRYL